MKILIAYFSYTGHTKGIAKKVQEMTGGTLFEIAPSEAYSSDYDTTERQGRGETRDGYMPPLAAQVEDFESYDTILLGTPNWFNTVAPPVLTFLHENDMAGKTIVPFCTNGGGGLGQIVSVIQKMGDGAKVGDALDLYEDGGRDAESRIAGWLKKNDIA